ncbi:alcohol dehydrogenase catalytic domain-containing protein [Alicyclobacillus sendaiensis]|uniref:Alcohol dehydrogenase catalytic domain-containing protein n=1 Tax=Alicyclobacillus sendaiensis PA2 TaxID=3029425 RepID=A0ABT6XWT0_ALISE|nr:alcohol dehydrogenase catalytic domain-containing protein [Alicyclobacillus sendaiensis]MDI9259553.1 alcohol dehydrogenase catalytic domain-containing protein [Alicyclobacillus sendaiensis PA2]
MRALVFDPESGLRVAEVPTPQPGPGEVLIRVEACGICGSDRQLVRGEGAPFGTSYPVVLGHEIAGRVEALGEGASGLAVGDPVVVHPFLPCGECAACARGEEHLCPRQGVIGFTRPGGDAEYVAVPAQNAIRRPEGLDAAEAAILVDAYATPYRAMVSAGAAEEEAVLVIGTGGLGLAAVQIAKALGVPQVAVLSRREDAGALALVSGADEFVTLAGDGRDAARRLRRMAKGGVGVVLDTSGFAEGIRFALEVLRPGGKVVTVAMPVDVIGVSMAKLARKGAALVGSFGSRREDVEALLAMAAEGRVQPDVVVGRRVSLEEAPDALQNPWFGRDVVVFDAP